MSEQVLHPTLMPPLMGVNKSSYLPFITMVILSLGLHVLIILGVTFIAPSSPQTAPKVNLEITLVREQTEEAPEEADFYAQANNIGGGEAEDKTPDPSLVPANVEAVEVEKPAEETASEIATPIDVPEPIATPSPTLTESQPQISPETPEIITTVVERPQQVTVAPEPVDIEDSIVQEQVAEQILEMPTADFLMADALNFARTKPIPNSGFAARKPTTRRISSSTKQYAAAAYLEGWQRKIERIGTMNYPHEAKRQGISGSLVLSVDLNPNGSLASIVLSKSSGSQLLDDAAIRIVNLAAPYAEIPENVLQGNDMLTIIRTWRFDASGRVRAR